MARTPLCALAMLDAMTGSYSDLTPHPLAGVRFAVIDAVRRDPALSPGGRHGSRVVGGAGGLRHDLDLPNLESCDQALMGIILPEATAVHEPILAANPDGYGPPMRRQLEMGFETPALDYVKANHCRAARSITSSIGPMFWCRRP